MLRLSAENANQCGLLLVGHGSREAIASEQFFALSELVAGRMPACAVEPCFLEFAEPTIAAGFRKLAARGVNRVVVVPVLLFAAGHAKRDIPLAVAQVAAEFPHISVTQCEHLGCHEALLRLSARRYAQAMAGQPPVDAMDTLLVMVGRGSHDPDAAAEMRRFTQLRTELWPVARAETCFVAMAEPNWEATLARVSSEPFRRVVVQPHLLFGGVLADRITARVEQLAREQPERQWLVTKPLGPERLLAEAVCGRAEAAISCRET